MLTSLLHTPRHDVALPRPPASVRISDVTATSVRIVWDYDVDPGEISFYIIQYKPQSVDRDYTEMSGLVTKFYTMTCQLAYLASLTQFSRHLYSY